MSAADLQANCWILKSMYDQFDHMNYEFYNDRAYDDSWAVHFSGSDDNDHFHEHVFRGQTVAEVVDGMQFVMQNLYETFRVKPMLSGWMADMLAQVDMTPNIPIFVQDFVETGRYSAQLSPVAPVSYEDWLQAQDVCMVKAQALAQTLAFVTETNYLVRLEAVSPGRRELSSGQQANPTLYTASFFAQHLADVSMTPTGLQGQTWGLLEAVLDRELSKVCANHHLHALHMSEHTALKAMTLPIVLPEQAVVETAQGETPINRFAAMHSNDHDEVVAYAER